MTEYENVGPAALQSACTFLFALLVALFFIGAGRGGFAGHFEWSNSMNWVSRAKLWSVIVPKIEKKFRHLLVKYVFGPILFLELIDVHAQAA